MLGYVIAFLVLLSTVKLWHLLRLNPKMNMITSALRRAWGDISGFVTIILVMLLAYSIAVSASRGNTSGQVLVEGKATWYCGQSGLGGDWESKGNDRACESRICEPGAYEIATFKIQDWKPQ